MSDNLFMDKENKPDYDKMVKVLGWAGSIWAELRQSLEKTHGPLIDEWKFYSAKYGWTLKLLKKKRNLFFGTVMKNRLRLSFVFGDKAVEAVQASELPQSIKQELAEARKYAEGRGVCVMVETREDVEVVKTLVEIKLKN